MAKGRILVNGCLPVLPQTPRWAQAKISAVERHLTEEIRREAFVVVSRATHPHEIASYVSDDFDLLVRGKLLGVDDSFLEQLWAAYQRSQFPYPCSAEPIE